MRPTGHQRDLDVMFPLPHIFMLPLGQTNIQYFSDINDKQVNVALSHHSVPIYNHSRITFLAISYRKTYSYIRDIMDIQIRTSQLHYVLPRQINHSIQYPILSHTLGHMVVVLRSMIKPYVPCLPTSRNIATNIFFIALKYSLYE